uniref:Uncharacterized protein n=1 Tax=Oryza rufipogon TaxID=4529 RepID=A0A0E0PRQ8_ORYRU
MVADLEPRSMGMARASRRRTPAERQEVEEVGGQSRRHTTRVMSYIVLLHISLLSRVPISGHKFCWLIAMPGWFSCWCCPGFQVQQLPSSKGTGLVFAMLLLLHQAARNGAPQPLVTT